MVRGSRCWPSAVPSHCRRAGTDQVQRLPPGRGRRGPRALPRAARVRAVRRREGRHVNLKDFAQLKKLLTLATSDNDHEALAAWRQATAIVARNGYTWEMVLNRTVTVLSEVEPVPIEDDDLSDLFDRALRNARGGFRQTIESIREQYATRGFLTPKQRMVIENAAERG